MESCIFCRIVDGETAAFKVAESTNFVAFLDQAPSVAGHTLIVPKKHATNFLDLPEYLGSEFVEFGQRVGAAVLAGTRSDGFHLNLNNGAAAGQVVFHAHFHLIPRKLDDGVVPFGQHLQLTDAEFAKVQQDIQRQLR